VIRDPCPYCKGKGIIKKKREIEVKIPKGIEDGSRLRLAGQGEWVMNGKPGDLYLFVHINDDPNFDRFGDDLATEAKISFPQAALGAEIVVPTMDGKEKLKIPAGTHSGEEFRIKGRGMPHLNGNGYGDLLVKIRVETPRKLSKKAKELLIQLSDELDKGMEKGFMKRFRR
jgi:molecular chaperone DnaJ